MEFTEIKGMGKGMGERERERERCRKGEGKEESEIETESCLLRENGRKKESRSRQGLSLKGTGHCLPCTE